MKPPALARQAIAHHLNSGATLEPPAGLPPELNSRAGVFVSLHQADGSLRGCIGTVEPLTPSVAEEIIANAVAAATTDPRFAPVQANELAGLHLSVDILTPLVAEPNQLALNPKQYGVMVAAADGRRGVLLPDLPGIATIEDQLEVCREKAAISPDEPVQIFKFQVTRYEE